MIGEIVDHGDLFELHAAWPTNEIAVMGAEGAANAVHRRQIADRRRPARRPEGCQYSDQAAELGVSCGR
ncbi:carboxyl transferase domain-containing protein [Streptomyces asiaticus]